MRDLRPNRWHMRYNLDGKIVPGGRDNFGPPDCCTTSTTTTTAIPGCNGYSGSITVGDLPIGFFPNGIGYIEGEIGSASPSPIIIPEGTVSAIVCIFMEPNWILAILSNESGPMLSVYEIIIDGISYSIEGIGIVPNNPFIIGQTYDICINYNVVTTTTSTTTTAIPEPIKYGLLYNWWNVEGAGGSSITSSDDWIIPSLADGQTLNDYLGAGGNYTSNLVGAKLKETGLTYWDSPSEETSTNEVGFNGRGAGIRLTGGAFLNLKVNGNLHTTTSIDAANNRYLALLNFTDTFRTSQFVGTYKFAGLSLRVMNPNTSLIDGEVGTYTGNDGKVYPTICIGTQEWISCNLAETETRDGSVIPEVQDNATWAALTTPALCIYNNDWNNL